MMNLLELAVWAQARQPGMRPGGPPTTSGDPGGAVAVILAVIGCVWLVFFLMGILTMIGMWKAYSKAGEPGWASIVPIYNLMVMARIAGKDEVQGLLCLIPVANIYFGIVLTIDFCKAFGKGAGFAIGMILLPFIFVPMLGFGSARYVGNRRRRSRDDDDDRPRRRRPVDEDEDDYEDDRPRRRREEEPRIRRPRRDEDD